jgi:SAM-dependent methyltransferase
MRRTLLFGGATVATLAVLVAVTLSFGRTAGDRKLVFKVTLPYEDASDASKVKLSVDGKEVDGTGLKRDVEYKLPAGKKAVTVSVLWEPNNYTKITRKRKVDIGDKDEIPVDLSAADPKSPDDIVVRFVPTPQDVVDEMCRVAKVGKNDIVYDLGCGDGRMVITAVKKFGAKHGVGIELKDDLVKQCKAKAKEAGVEDRVEFRQGDVLKVKDLSDATVVLLYMGDDINLRLRPILQKTLKPGSRVVSHRFTMGDWEPTLKTTVNSTEYGPCDVLLWIIKGEKQGAE